MVDNFESLIARTPQQFRDRGIDARVCHVVEAIDLRTRRVSVQDTRTGKTSTEPFDYLLVATGAEPVIPAISGIDAQNIFAIKTLTGASALKQTLDSPDVRKVVVVGGGYIGLEMADNLITRGLDVTLIERGPHVMSTMDGDMGQTISDTLRTMGVHLQENEQVERFESQNGKVTAVVTDHHRYVADVVVLGLGVKPRTTLARMAGLPVGVRDALIVDDRMATSMEGIWAAGDCTASRHLVSNRLVHIALATVANKQGRVAGINIGGGVARFPGVVGTAITKVGTLEIARTGLDRHEIESLGLDFAEVSITTETRLAYYPGVGTITVKLLGEKGTGRLLGGQIVGTEGSGKRIDVIATALFSRMSVTDLIDLDLAYAPPFSDAWDPVQIAARQLSRRLTLPTP